MLAAAQGVDFRREALGEQATLGCGTQAAYTLIRERVPFVEADTVLYPYVEAVRQLVASGAITAAVEAAIEH